VLVNLHDVTDRHLAEEELRHQAYHDPVTGAGNRSMLAERIEQATLRYDEEGGSRALLLVDIDEFARVNERFGHERGDALLRELNERLRSVVRSGDTVARLGGDEFALLIAQTYRGADEASVLAERILRRIAEPFVVAGETLLLSGTIGIAVASSVADHERLLRDAGVALASAKVEGKGRFVVFEPSMRHDAINRLRLETDLVVALERDQFVLHYQPLLDLQSGVVRGVEALLRWDHPEVGLIPPDRFIPLAEQNGLIVPIGEWVIRTASATAALWRRALGSDLEMSVNVSARQLTSEALVPTVQLALAESGLPPSKLVVEITETTLIADSNLAASRLAELRQIGVRIAIDDFGTGYSSLSYLQQFPVDVLKIDRTFVNAIVDDGPLPPLVHGLVELAKTLGLEIVAEGIEYEHQFDHLRAEGCQFGQGYYFSRPLPEAEALTLIGRHPLSASG
jgi:diguanylate cyclase (GGDEF)-like protein